MNLAFKITSILGLFLLTQVSYAQSKQEMRAQKGEKVVIITATIKAEAKEDYEKWIRDIFYGVINNDKSPTMQEQYLKARWLTPTRQNEDGTWTYLFLMDPWVEDGDYHFQSVLERKYSKEETQQLLELELSYLAEPRKLYSTYQSEH